MSAEVESVAARLIEMAQPAQQESPWPEPDMSAAQQRPPAAATAAPGGVRSILGRLDYHRC